MGHFIWWTLWEYHPCTLSFFQVTATLILFFIHGWARSWPMREHYRYIGNVFSHWPRPCSAIDRKRAEVLWGYPWVINDGDWWWLTMMMIMRRWKKEEGREWSSSSPIQIQIQIQNDHSIFPGQWQTGAADIQPPNPDWRERCHDEETAGYHGQHPR